ncbi:hypothetical protein FisN_3Hh329 [Fistulifera solaris]|uniref:Uncharacterized protein n=1 Tax=Fistulifera solaris TaxID=1519565 RepID=A0A1Z5JQ83_FISSO|nr:hypothetical protein FisN_3Hh329 [Fistulifera solaris]|eukprot:GAX16190.1 hypothetical protein FisN_3Hh329 [Fistulifera solaris]
MTTGGPSRYTVLAALVFLFSLSAIPLVSAATSVALLTDVDEIVQSLAEQREQWNLAAAALPQRLEKIQSDLDDKLRSISDTKQLETQLQESTLEIEKLQALMRNKANASGENTVGLDDMCSEHMLLVENRYKKEVEDLIRTVEDLQRQVKISDLEIGELQEASELPSPVGADELSQELHVTFIETERVKLLGASLETKDGLELLGRKEEINKLLGDCHAALGEDHALSAQITDFSGLLQSTLHSVEKRLSGIESYRHETVQVLRQKDNLLRRLQADALVSEKETERKLKELDAQWKSLVESEKDQLLKENALLLEKLEQNALIQVQESKQAYGREIKLAEDHASLLEQYAGLQTEKEELQMKLATLLENTEKNAIVHEQVQNESNAITRKIEQECQLRISEQQGVVSELESIVTLYTAENGRLKNELNSLEGKYDEVLNVMDKAAELYSEQHFDQVLQEKTKLISSEWKQKFESLEARTNDLLAEAEQTTKRALDAFRTEAQKKMDLEVLSYQEQLLEQGALCKREMTSLFGELSAAQEALKNMSEDLQSSLSKCS